MEGKVMPDIEFGITLYLVLNNDMKVMEKPWLIYYLAK